MQSVPCLSSPWVVHSCVLNPRFCFSLLNVGLRGQLLLLPLPSSPFLFLSMGSQFQQPYAPISPVHFCLSSQKTWQPSSFISSCLLYQVYSEVSEASPPAKSEANVEDAGCMFLVPSRRNGHTMAKPVPRVLPLGTAACFKFLQPRSVTSS